MVTGERRANIERTHFNVESCRLRDLPEHLFQRSKFLLDVIASGIALEAFHLKVPGVLHSFTQLFVVVLRSTDRHRALAGVEF